MIEYKIYKEDPGKDWDDFVQQHSRRNPFQTRALFHFYTHTNEFTPYFCIAKNTQNHKIVGGFLFVIQHKKMHLLGKLFSRALIVGGPLILTHGRHVLNGMLEAYSKFIRNKVIFTEIRNLHQWQHYYDTFLKQGFAYEAHLNYQVELHIDNVEANFSSSKRRQIRKAQKNGATIEENPSIEQVKAFYTILQKLYNTRINKPLPDWSFFSSFYTHIVKKGMGKYILIMHQEEVIGGIMLPLCDNKMAFEWYVAGNDKAYKHQYPSVLATWAGIHYAQQHGYAGFDFMGAGKPNQAYGVREFKSKFGGKLLNYGRFYKKHRKLLYFMLKIYLNLKDKYKR